MVVSFFFFFNDTATTEIYTLSLHDALPICMLLCLCSKNNEKDALDVFDQRTDMPLKREHLVSWRINWNRKSENIKSLAQRSEEHTSELQSPCNLVCRLLLEKKKKQTNYLLITHVNALSLSDGAQ